MDATAELTELEHQLIRAVGAHDVAFLDSVLGDDFTLTTGRPGAEVRSRDEWLRVSSADYAIHDYAFEELVVRTYGSAAVVQSRYSQHGEMAGERRNTTYRMTDVWARDDQGRWRLHVRHAQPVAGD